MENVAAPTQTAAEVEVEVKRIERYACGCTTTRIHTSLLGGKYLLACPTHRHSLARVETVMEYRPVQPEDETE